MRSELTVLRDGGSNPLLRTKLLLGVWPSGRRHLICNEDSSGIRIPPPPPLTVTGMVFQEYWTPLFYREDLELWKHQ